MEEAGNFLLNACPGAGKTVASGECAAYRFREHGDAFLVVIVPTTELRKQWADALQSFGFTIDPRFNAGDGFAPDINGITVTYQAVAMNPGAYRAIVSARKTFVITDEIHHAGESAKWGLAISHAIEPARRRLHLTGTAFRTDSTRIPFLKYGDDGKCDATAPHGFTYSIKDAIGDGVIPVTTFHSFDGDMEWFSGQQRFTASFRDEVPDDEAGRRLKTALDVNGEWLPDVLRRADADLQAKRRGNAEAEQEPDPMAAGLVVCYDRNHADAVGALLAGITGETPVVVHGAKPDPGRLIDDFKKGGPRWIVAVQMVSEGIDIPRLRVGVYATNKMTLVVFMQITGRLWRAKDEVSMYVPAVDTLLSYAEKIDQDIAEGLAAEPAREVEWEWEPKSDDVDIICGPGPGPIPTTFRPVGSFATEWDVIDANGRFSADEMAVVQSYVSRYPDLKTARPTALALLIREIGPSRVNESDVPTNGDASPEPRPAWRSKADLTKKRGPRDSNVNAFAALLNKWAGVTDWAGEVPRAMVQKRLKAMYGGRPPKELTVEEVREQIELLARWIEGLDAAHHADRAKVWAAEWMVGNEAFARVS